MKNILWLAALLALLSNESLAQNLPDSIQFGAVNFNQLYNGANVVTKSTGYSGMVYTDLTTGNFAIETGGTNTAGSTVTRSGLVYVTPGGSLGLATSTPRVSLDMGFKADALLLQTGTTGQRPASPVVGMVRYNSTTSAMEVYQGSSPAWTTFGGSATSGSTMYLGADATHTSPSRSDDVTTGLFSATATSVSVSIAGTERFKVNAAGVDVTNVTDAYYLGGNKVMFQPQGDITSFAAGTNALISQTTTYWGANTAVGINTLRKTTTGGGNAALGFQALYNNVNGNDNTAIGSVAMENNTSGRTNTAIGSFALHDNTTGTYNTAIGTSALQRTVTNSSSVAVGVYALNNAQADGNVAVGMQAMEQTTTGASNVAVGNGAMDKNTTGSRNVALGTGALTYGISGSSNIAIGVESLESSFANGLTGNANIGIGDRTLFSIQTTATANTALGVNAGYNLTTGANNLILGPRVAYVTLATGSNNILIGTSSLVDTTATDSSNQLNIGNLITGDMAAGKVGIGRTADSINATLDVNGYMKLAKNSSEPETCDAAKDGAIALTSGYMLCVCKDGSGWVIANDGLTLCTW